MRLMHKTGMTVHVLAAFVVALAIPLCLSLTDAASAKTREPVYVKAYGGFKHRPARLALWVSDSLVNLRWSGWGKSVASATGEVTEHSGGVYRTVPARIELSGIARCSGRLVYLAVRYRIWDGPWKRGHSSNCQVSA